MTKKIIKVLKGFGITIVICFALFGVYKLLKPAPNINVSNEDIQYLRNLGIEVAEDGQASESGASSLLGNIEGDIPLNSAGTTTGNFQSQAPPAFFGNTNPPTGAEIAPTFGIDNHNHNHNNTNNSNVAPPFNPTNITPTTSTQNNANIAPAWNRNEGQNDINHNQNMLPPNVPLAASLPHPVEPQYVAPSSPYGSQQYAPPITIPPSFIPTNNTPPLPTNLPTTIPIPTTTTIPTTTIPTAPIPTMPIPTNQLPNNQFPITQPTASTFNITETPNSTLPNTNTPSVLTTPSPNLTPPPSNTFLINGNQAFTPPTPIQPVAPPPSPPLPPLPPLSPTPLLPSTPTFPATFPPTPTSPQPPQPLTQTQTNINPTFVNTGLRDNQNLNQNLNQNNFNNSNTTQNTLNQSETTQEQQQNINNNNNNNDPNYYSSAVPITTRTTQISSSPTQNNSLPSEMVTLEKPAQYSSAFSSNISSPTTTPSDSLPSPPPASLSFHDADARLGSKSVVKPLPVVIESDVEDKTYIDANNRYIHAANNHANNRVNNHSNNYRQNNYIQNVNATNNTSNLWGDYLNKVKQNNKAVLEPSRDAADNIAARVAFAKNESNINNFTPNYGARSADIFTDSDTQVNLSSGSGGVVSGIELVNPVIVDNVLSKPLPVKDGLAKVSLARVGYSSDKATNSGSGVVATSGTELIDYAIADLDKNDKSKNNNNAKHNGNEQIAKINNNSNGNNSEQNTEQIKEPEKKFNSVVSDSSVIPFVTPPVEPHPVLVTTDLTTGNIFNDTKLTSNNSPKPNQNQNQNLNQNQSLDQNQSLNQNQSQNQNQVVRESVIHFVTEQIREYGTGEQSKMHLAFVQLSKFYDQRELSDVERDYVAPVLDRVALELIYSSKYHVLEPAYRIKAGDTIESIAQQFSISPALLSKINALNSGERLATGSELKVVHGQFDAKVYTGRGELTLLLGGVYAGRFPVAIGRNVMGLRGEFIVQNKNITKTTKTLTLNNGITLNGLGRNINQDSLGVSQENIEELFDILTENSVIVLEN